ncbi:NADH-quinone oxidoreductase subunit J family protein [Verrucomicrobiota bacterium sgz303538]
MSPVLFWLLAVLMLAFGVLVIVNRNPVASALSLVVSFLCLAGLFVGLDAFFIGVIQVLVYAGAVMVLFLFIIMLLDLKAEQRRKLNLFATAGGILVSLAFVAQLVLVLDRFTTGQQPFPVLGVAQIDDVRQVGMTLFSTHNLPFQVVGVLILVATVGVVVLSRRELK